MDVNEYKEPIQVAFKRRHYFGPRNSTPFIGGPPPMDAVDFAGLIHDVFYAKVPKGQAYVSRVPADDLLIDMVGYTGHRLETLEMSWFDAKKPIDFTDPMGIRGKRYVESQNNYMRNRENYDLRKSGDLLRAVKDVANDMDLDFEERKVLFDLIEQNQTVWFNEVGSLEEELKTDILGEEHEDPDESMSISGSMSDVSMHEASRVYVGGLESLVRPGLYIDGHWYNGSGVFVVPGSFDATSRFPVIFNGEGGLSQAA